MISVHIVTLFTNFDGHNNLCNSWGKSNFPSVKENRGSLSYLILHPQFKIDDSYIQIHLFILLGYIKNSQYDQLPIGLIAAPAS